MTFCLGIRVQHGLVALADTRITSGSECIQARKVKCYHHDSSASFVMTSGLRSIRDKVVTYFDEVMEDQPPQDKLYKVVNQFAAQIRRVAREDRASLVESGMTFDIHAIIGGQCSGDAEPKLYLIYPQANWVEIAPGTPYVIIGAQGYGKPVLDRTLTYQDSMRFALKVASLAFDSTRISAADVDLPVDVVMYERDSFRMVEHRLDIDMLSETSNWWQEELRRRINELPTPWIEGIMSQLPSERNTEARSG